MQIIIEEHQYPAEAVRDVLNGISNLRDVDGMVSVSYVGYYYNPTLDDCVFILPKVLMDENGLLFGNYAPEDVIDLDEQTLLSAEEYNFVYELAVWVYRAIAVYRDTAKDTSIVKQLNVQQMSKGRLQKSNTFLDILLALLKFNKENQDFFFFILRNIHSGYNKINWTRTIAHSAAFLQNGAPVYINPVNKKRQINFDEELLVIFFSILYYINYKYGFPVKINVSFPLITGAKFENYRDGMGKVRLMQIKYKYFSDKALYLWELCFAFFDQSKKINIETNEKEYLLVKNFNIVFEAIIDELVGSKDLPDELINQQDGKRVDHMYQYRDLTNNDDDKPIYYIGDSKYYKRGNTIGANSVYKQFTYARNVIQWNIDLFSSDNVEKQKGHLKLRDDVTEGYNVIPNFFISAHQNTLERKDDIQCTNNVEKEFLSKQYDNRLFDRDTFLIAHYDVNFLFVIALYGRNNGGEKEAWKDKVRRMFRKEIQEMLSKHYDFYAMTAKSGVSAVSYINDHFQELLGKVFTPYEDRGLQKYYSVALDRDKKYADDNAALIEQLSGSFHIAKCKIGDDPKKLLPEVEPMAIYSKPDKFLTFHYLENHEEKQVLVGCYKGQKQLDWILGKNDRGTLIYNIRLEGTGSHTESSLRKRTVSFVVIYEYGNESNYRVFKVHHNAVMDKERIEKSGYPNPHHEKYFCYVFDEEVTLGTLDIPTLISKERIDQRTSFIEGAPIFKTGKEMMEYRR